MPIKSVIHTNEQSIERVIQAGVPVLLYFWNSAGNGGPRFDGVLDNLAEEYAGTALIAKVDVGAEPGLQRRFKVSAIPSCVIINQGKVEDTLDGLPSEASLRDWLKYLVHGGQKPAAKQPAPKGVSAAANGATNGAQGKPLVLTDANFRSTIAGPQPVLVDFWAPWCGPCRMVAPSVETLAKEFQGRAVVAKLNVDENQRTAQSFGIQSIPSLYIFRNGQVVDRIVGAQPLHVLRDRLARHAG